MSTMWIEEYCQDRVSRGEIVERSARNFRSYLKVWHEFAGPVEDWTPASVHDRDLSTSTP